MMPATGCEPPVSLLVEIDSELEPGIDADALEVSVSTLIDEVWVAQNTQRRELAFGRQRLLITRGTEGDTIRAEIDALLGEDVVLAVTRTWSLGRSSSVQRVCLRRGCIGSSDEVCLQGACEPGNVSSSEPSRWTPDSD
jgi:hypothetical protein